MVWELGCGFDAAVAQGQAEPLVVGCEWRKLWDDRANVEVLEGALEPDTDEAAAAAWKEIGLRAGFIQVQKSMIPIDIVCEQMYLKKCVQDNEW